MNRNKGDIHKLIDLDPFQNMVMRPNRSPVLKPVVVASRAQLQVSRSAGSLREKFKLPPVNPSRKTQNFNFAPVLDRGSLKTPSFKITTKLNEGKINTKNCKSKPPIPEVFSRKKINEKELQFINSNLDVSFGDIDENCLGINEKMKKYKY